MKAVTSITSSGICGSDLHIYKGALLSQKRYVVGYELMGIVEDIGKKVTKAKKGDCMVLPFNIAWNRISCSNECFRNFEKRSVVR